jgi:hypothetical protein
MIPGAPLLMCMVVFSLFAFYSLRDPYAYVLFPFAGLDEEIYHFGH